jgi:hypothetical protein
VRRPSKESLRREATKEWWARGPWPAIVLAVDPGKISGATIAESGPGGIRVRLCEQVDIYAGRGLEEVVEYAAGIAESEGLPFAACLETWGSGGPMGLDHWIGLGEARGPWRRELVLASKRYACVVRSRICLVTQSRWRSRVVPETGGVGENGEWRPFSSEEWKEAALRAAMSYVPDAHIPPLDAAESACMACYFVRSDELLEALSRRELDRYGIPEQDRRILEDAIGRRGPIRGLGDPRPKRSRKKKS